MNDIRARAARSTGQVAIALTVALLGFLLAIQLRAQQGLTDRLGLERESDLGRILTELGERNDELQNAITDLRVRLATRTGSAAQERALLQDLEKQVDALRVMLGVVPVRGRGIVITIADPERDIGPEVLLDTIEELRDAGAEAIDVDGTRVVSSTSFGGGVGSVRIGDTILSAPYRIAAIGTPATLAEAMRIPGGVVDAVGARAGASVRIEQRSSVTISSISKLPTFRYARPRPRR